MTQLLPKYAFFSMRYPNPEEDGALDMAIATADAHGARYIGVKTASVAQSNARIDALKPALQALIAQHS